MYVPVKICAVGDPVAFPELADTVVNGECLGFAILEKGTTAGKTSCAIIIQAYDDVPPVFVEFTGDMFLTMAAALKGARERFGDPWDGV